MAKTIDPSAPKPQIKQEGGPNLREISENHKYLRPRPDLIAKSGLTEEQIAKFRRIAERGVVAQAEAAAQMGQLINVKEPPSNALIAREHTDHFFTRYPRPTAIEIGMWEALRDPATGVPPRNVSGTPEYYVVDH